MESEVYRGQRGQWRRRPVLRDRAPLPIDSLGEGLVRCQAPNERAQVLKETTTLQTTLYPTRRWMEGGGEGRGGEASRDAKPTVGCTDSLAPRRLEPGIDVADNGAHPIQGLLRG